MRRGEHGIDHVIGRAAFVEVEAAAERDDPAAVQRADVRFPMAPPANLHRAMVGSDEVIIITDLEWANRFAHVNAVRETCEANGKIASVEPGMGEWGLTLEDIETATKRARAARRRARSSG